MTVCASFESSNVKFFYDPGSFEYNVKVRCVTCNVRSFHRASFHRASFVKISSLHLNWLLIYGHLFVPLVIMDKFNFDPQNPEMKMQ